MKNKKSKSKIKNVILKSISYFTFILLIVAICFVNYNSHIPFYVIIICLMWLVPFGIANKIIQL